MKITKKLAAIAATAIMAITSIGGMSASAVDNTDFTEDNITTMSLGEFMDICELQTYYRGTYYDIHESSNYIKFDGEYLTVKNVYSQLDTTGRFITGTSEKNQKAISDSGCSATFKKGDYQYLYQGNMYDSNEDTSIDGVVTLSGVGTFQKVTITFYSKKYPDVAVQTFEQYSREIID